MSADCFSTDHFKMQPQCNGPVKWSEYCQQFKALWEESSLDVDGVDVSLVGDDGESRVEKQAVEHEALKKKLEEAVKVSRDLEAKLLAVQEENDEVDELRNKVKKLEEENLGFVLQKEFVASAIDLANQNQSSFNSEFRRASSRFSDMEIDDKDKDSEDSRAPGVTRALGESSVSVSSDSFTSAPVIVIHSPTPTPPPPPPPLSPTSPLPSISFSSSSNPS